MCVAMCVCTDVSVPGSLGFYNCPCHIFRGDDKHGEMSCLSERATNYCLVFLLVQKSFKNTNDFYGGHAPRWSPLCSAEMIPLEATEF